MPRRAALVLVLAVVSVALGAGAASALVLGSKSHMTPQGSGRGTEKPERIINGGASSGLAHHRLGAPLLPIARLPRAGEKRAIRRAAMRDCRPQEVRHYKCKWVGHAKVSTVNARYAWAEVAGPNYDNSGVLRRGKRHPGRWKMIRVVGGGIMPCSYWRAAVPRRVVTDLGIEGFTDGDQTFTYHPC